MKDDEPKGTNRVFKWPCKRQRHSNVGSTNSMGPHPPGSEGNMPIRKIVHAHLCGQGGTSKAFGSSTNYGNQKVKLSKPITKKVHNTFINWYVQNNEVGINWKIIWHVPKY